VSEHLMVIAVATSLATIVVTSISSVRAHHKRGAVQWPILWMLTPGILIGAWLGALTADWLSNVVLTGFFGSAVILIGLQMWLAKQPEQGQYEPGRLAYGGSGIFIGWVSAMIGIGGGSLTVPLLHYWRKPMVKAVATAAAGGLPIAMGGTLGFIYAGWGVSDLPAHSLGYVYLPAAGLIVVSSSLFAPLGAHWAHRVKAAQLKKGFAVFLILVGIKVLLSL
ncbi:MAG: sulfite exporter TauE/SafE family protein, partial [Gammaproteobacteria bacterium]|nr:sulfite exporter TauE/SafE family protein [Gammaproteobacteria bacterium]